MREAHANLGVRAVLPPSHSQDALHVELPPHGGYDHHIPSLDEPFKHSTLTPNPDSFTSWPPRPPSPGLSDPHGLPSVNYSDMSNEIYSPLLNETFPVSARQGSIEDTEDTLSSVTPGCSDYYYNYQEEIILFPGTTHPLQDPLSSVYSTPRQSVLSNDQVTKFSTLAGALGI